MCFSASERMMGTDLAWRIWTTGAGRIRRPGAGDIFFLPQRPYFAARYLISDKDTTLSGPDEVARPECLVGRITSGQIS